MNLYKKQPCIALAVITVILYTGTININYYKFPWEDLLTSDSKVYRQIYTASDVLGDTSNEMMINW